MNNDANIARTEIFVEEELRRKLRVRAVYISLKTKDELKGSRSGACQKPRKRRVEPSHRRNPRIVPLRKVNLRVNTIRLIPLNLGSTVLS